MEKKMSDLRGRSAPAKMNAGSGGKIVAAIIVILGVGALAAYGYETGQLRAPPKPVVSNSQLPTLPR